MSDMPTIDGTGLSPFIQRTRRSVRGDRKFKGPLEAAGEVGRDRGDEGERRRRVERGRCVRHDAVGEPRELSEPEWASGPREDERGTGWEGIPGRLDTGASEVEVVG